MSAPAPQQVDPASQVDLAVVVEVAGGHHSLSPGSGRENLRQIFVIRLASSHHEHVLSVQGGG